MPTPVPIMLTMNAVMIPTRSPSHQPMPPKMVVPMRTSNLVMIDPPGGVPAKRGPVRHRTGPLPGNNATVPETLSQHLPEVRVGERGAVGALVQVRASAVPALGVLVVIDRLVHVGHFRHHLARVTRMHTVVARIGVEEHLRVRLRRVEILVRRPLLDVV